MLNLLVSFLELQAANKCKVGDKILNFLRGKDDGFERETRMIKEQNAAEYENARGGLRKAGLLNQEKDNPRQKNKGPRGKGSGKNDSQSKGGPKAKGCHGKAKALKDKKCHKCKQLGHIKANCKN